MHRLLTFILVLTSFSVFSQNLDKIGKKDMITVSGGINANIVANQAVNQEQFRDPFSWVLSGNLTVNIVDVSLPFTFSYSNTGKNYTQPFNMTAVHPTYKKWTAHLGITSMNFSPYTYQGMNFTGAGLEYKPKKWGFKAFGGRLKKAIEYDADVNNVNSVSYSRMGFGFGTEYKGKSWGTEILLLKAYDDATSLVYYHNNPELTAKDNIVASLKGNVSLFKSLKIKGEIASSVLTRNILANETASNISPLLGSFVQANNTTVVRSAYNASMDYRYKKFGIGLKYERIAPDYSTLGAVYFNNDLENITLNPSFTLFKNKVNLNFSTGYQRNNLNAKNASESKRWIGTASLSAQLIKGMSLNANYSNMSSFSKKNPAADPFYNTFGDTLNYYQTSENYSTSINYSFGKEIKQAVNLTGSYSKSQNITGRLQDAAAFGLNVNSNASDAPVDVYNGVVSHTFKLAKKGMSIGWMANANHTVVMGTTNTFFGPGMNASKSVLEKKMALNLGVNYNQQYTQSMLSNHVMNLRFGMRYSPKFKSKKVGSLSMSMNGNWTNKFAVASTDNTQMITIIANIAYRF